MNRSWKAGIIVVALFGVACIMGTLLSAQEASAQAPVQVILIGEILTAKETGQANTYSLQVTDKTLRYRVDQGVTPAYAMEATTIYDILGDLGPPTIRVEGKEAIIQPLIQPGVEGKHWRIEGALYVRDHLLKVTKIEEVKPRPKKK